MAGAFLFLASVAGVQAQARPTATQRLQLSAFGGVCGVYTGLNSGRNLSLLFGADLTFPSRYSLFPSFEVRGTYPVKDGQVDSQRNLLGGLKIEKHFGPLRPYGDILFGRGQINYGAGLPTPARTVFYVQNPSNVFSAGLGVEVQVISAFSLKLDSQFQRYSSPVSESGHVVAENLTGGVVYHFSFRHHPR